MARNGFLSLPAWALVLSCSWLVAEEPQNILLDPRRLAAAIDRVVTNRMAEKHIPGAVVTVVHGRKAIFNKGYGFANLEERNRVSGENAISRRVCFEGVQRHGGAEAGG
jgi:CubicO group peptidase (beta-lactamase class C family)